MNPNITPHTIPAIAPPLRPRFASWFFDTGKGGGEEMMPELACDCESAEPEDDRSGALELMVARRRRGRRLLSFILMFGFECERFV
jgi:hypothetical protein